MKLSQMTTDRAMDALCDIIPAIGNICADPDLTQLLRQLAGHKVTEFKTIAQKIAFAANTVNQIAPMILKSHKEDVFRILAAINECSVDDIRKQNVLVTFRQIQEAVKDPELLALFRSQSQMGDAKSSGSASESTEEN